ncbi:MAG: aminopeptidase P family protein [bacterium]|nr:aminopeptidase P family protein [bacterium]
MHHITIHEINDRLDRLRKVLRTKGLDGALLHGVTNLFYFSGTAQQAHLWVPSESEAQLLVRRVLERARAESPLSQIEALTSLKALPEVLRGASRVGLELDLMPVSHFRRYENVLEHCELCDVGPATRVIRAVKSEHEIALIRAAAETAEATFNAVRDGLREGISELELAIVAESAERRHGFQGTLRWRATTGFECPWVHILSGPSALEFSFADTPFGGPGLTPAVPYGASQRIIGRGEPVCVDIAIARDGYIHDMTRTFSVGELPQRLVDAYEVCRQMHQMFREEARPGVTGEGFWQRCVAIADETSLGEHFMGFGAQRVHFVGHGLGLELDELPVLAPRQAMPLAAGNVIALEPKFFFPGLGAVGLENTYAIHADRVETITLGGEEITVVE